MSSSPSSSAASKRHIRRPWDKHHQRVIPVKKKQRLPPRSSTTPAACWVEVPTADGRIEKFFSDALYLNTSIYEEENEPTARTPSSVTGASSCHCGARDPPPLLSRSKLVQSLDLKAAILATFSWEPRAMAHEFPSLLGPEATVPTLVLHGKKGWTVESFMGVEKSSTTQGTRRDDDDDDDEPESVPLHDEFSSSTPSGSDEDDDDATCCGCSIGTQDEAAVATSKKYAHVQSFSSPSPQKKEVSEPVPKQQQQQQQQPLRPPPLFPATAHFSEITPTWLPPENIFKKNNNNNAPSSSSSSLSYSHLVDPETGALHSWIVQQRLYCRGVHHPKYMLLFERDGSVVVVVSTSNLSAQVSTEGSWIQRFPAVATASSSTTGDGGSDFGAVLTNFLHCQMLATAPGQLTVHAFVQRYLDWKSLAELERRFDYRCAQVQLIATVPGDHPGQHSSSEASPAHHRNERLDPHSKTNNASISRKFLYGPQRMVHVLAQRKIPPSLLDDNDRLIFQPTSFGGDWDPRSLANLVRSYMGYVGPGASPIRDADILQRLDIVWPTDYFVRELSKYIPDQYSNQHRVVPPAADISLGFASFAEAVRDTKVDPEKENGGKLFFSAESFNRLHWDCLSRMVLYESSVPAQRPILLTPHFKSVARLFDGKSDYRIRKELGVPKCEAYFSWFLLTSACLSRGAQGEVAAAATRPRVVQGGLHSYANFELGVLFTSRKDRLYCWKPMSCCCNAASTGSTTTRLIHIPSPYCFRPAPYVAHEDDEEFCETPYFHEILRDNACAGNLLATPYGKALAEQYANNLR